jgi:hypothetical protein
MDVGARRAKGIWKPASGTPGSKRSDNVKTGMQKEREELVKVRQQKRLAFFRKLGDLHDKLNLANTALSLCGGNSQGLEDKQLGCLAANEACNANVVRLQEEIHVHEASGRGKRRKLAVCVKPWYGVSEAMRNWT